MRIRRRSFTSLLLATPFSMSGALGASAQNDEALAYYRQAKVDWQQAKGQSLTIGLNKHPFTESLLPLIPQFRSLTGINVEYLILPEAEYFTKLVADLSQQRGEFSVIMTGPMRNWQYVPPDWILPLDDFLNNPKLTDLGWFKLDDFYPALIAANRWNGKTGGGVGEGPLYSIPVLEESYILAYRKDIFDQYNIKVPTTLEEMAEAARLVKKNAGIPGIVARGTPSVASMGTGFISGLKSYTDGQWSEFDDKLNANFHDPRSVKFTETVDRHGPRQRSAELGQHAVVRRHGGLHGRSGRHDRRRGLLRRQLRRSQEVEGRGQGRLRADPGRPGRQDVRRPLDLGARHQQGDQEQGSGLAVRAMGDGAAHPAERHHRAIATTIRPASRSPTTRASRRSWRRGAAAAT